MSRTPDSAPVTLSWNEYERLQRLYWSAVELRERILCEAEVNPHVIPEGRTWCRFCFALETLTENGRECR